MGRSPLQEKEGNRERNERFALVVVREGGGSGCWLWGRHSCLPAVSAARRQTGMSAPHNPPAFAENRSCKRRVACLEGSPVPLREHEAIPGTDLLCGTRCKPDSLRGLPSRAKSFGVWSS